MSQRENPLILIVEDDPSIRLGLRKSLSFDGFQVIEAGDGEFTVVLETGMIGRRSNTASPSMRRGISGYRGVSAPNLSGPTMPFLNSPVYLNPLLL